MTVLPGRDVTSNRGARSAPLQRYSAISPLYPDRYTDIKNPIYPKKIKALNSLQNGLEKTVKLWAKENQCGNHHHGDEGDNQTILNHALTIRALRRYSPLILRNRI